MEGARAATPDDLDRLAELAEQAVAELAAAKGGALWARREARPAPMERSLRAALDDANHLVLVGTIETAVVGYAVVRTEHMRDEGITGVIEDLYVEPEARGVGVGEALMDEIVAWCEAAGCEGIDAWALPGSRETKNFFESFGLTARAIIVHRSLQGPPAK